MLRLLAVGDFVGVALEIFRGPRSGPVCAAETNSSSAGVLGDADTAVAAAVARVKVAKTFWVPRLGQLPSTSTATTSSTSTARPSATTSSSST